MNRAHKEQRGMSRVALSVVFLLAALNAYAEVYVAKDSAGNFARLLDEPCPVASGWLVMKKAEMHFQGKLYKACWILSRDRVLIFDEAGDLSAVPVSMFAKEDRT